MHFPGSETRIEGIISERCVQLVHAQIMKVKYNI